MPRGISPNTIQRYRQIVDAIRNSDQAFTAKLLAEHMGVPLQTVTYIIRRPPFDIAFEFNQWGVIKLTGHEVDLFNDLDLSEVGTERLLVLLTQRYPYKQQVVKKIFEKGNPLVEMYHAVAQAKELLINGGDVNKLLPGKALSENIDDIEQFAVELLRFVQRTKSKPNYGKKEWWIDYIEPE